MTNTNDAPRSLAPCPFCGSGVVEMYTGLNEGAFIGACRVACLGCGARTGLSLRQVDVREAWNTRAPRSPAPLGWRPTADELVNCRDAIADVRTNLVNRFGGAPSGLSEIGVDINWLEKVCDHFDAREAEFAAAPALPVAGGLGSSSPKSDDTQPVAETPGVGDDDWIEWAGGENPVPGQMVEARFRGGATEVDLSDDWYWQHSGCHSDLVAYRLAAQPKQESGT